MKSPNENSKLYMKNRRGDNNSITVMKTDYTLLTDKKSMVDAVIVSSNLCFLQQKTQVP